METPENQIILKNIAEEVGVTPRQAAETLRLLEEGGTVPFIARYRKEATGNLDEVQIRDIAEKRVYYRELLERKGVILKSIEEQGKLSPELRMKIEGCYEKTELEDLYLPYKPKRKTRATVAIEKGLEPLARFIYEQAPGDSTIEALTAEFISAEKGVASVDDALEGALHIIAEWVAENADLRKGLREMMLRDGLVVSRLLKGKGGGEGEGKKTKFEMYYDFREPVAVIPSHRMLAVRRGEDEKVLAFSIEIDEEKALSYLNGQVIRDSKSVFVPYLEKAIKDSYSRLLNPSIQTEVRLALKKRADEEAIKVFDENLKNLLLAPPAGPITVIGVDPGVDLNTASFALLRYVAGINESVARKVVKYREEQGTFRSRQSLLNVSGFGGKTFQQAAGFLRIKNGENPLDGTAVHPESYPVVEKMASSLGLKVAELIENAKVIPSLDIKRFVDERAGVYTLSDIREELLKPGRDPREKFATATFREDVKEITDLQEGMVLEGTVTNVTNFGAFVDIGVHQDGLVHISELSNKFIKDPKEAVRVGEVVKVKVLSVDLPIRRISLSRKALLTPAGTETKKGNRKETQKPAVPRSLSDQLTALKSRFEKK